MDSSNESLAAQVSELRARLAAVERRRQRRLLALGAALLAGTAMAAAWPANFRAGTPARAFDLNDYFNDLKGRIDALETTLRGTIAFFPASTCPTGWTRYAAANGRFIVGTPSSGTGGVSVGTPLADGTPPTHQHHLFSKTSANGWQGYPETSPGSGVGHTTLQGIGVAIDDGTGADYGLAVDAAGIVRLYSSTTSANLPYVQLTACQKN